MVREKIFHNRFLNQLRYSWLKIFRFIAFRSCSEDYKIYEFFYSARIFEEGLLVRSFKNHLKKMNLILLIFSKLHSKIFFVLQFLHIGITFKSLQNV